jgi:hypothetical protein
MPVVIATVVMVRSGRPAAVTVTGRRQLAASWAAVAMVMARSRRRAAGPRGQAAGGEGAPDGQGGRAGRQDQGEGQAAGPAGGQGAADDPLQGGGACLTGRGGSAGEGGGEGGGIHHEGGGERAGGLAGFPSAGTASPTAFRRGAVAGPAG